MWKQPFNTPSQVNAPCTNKSDLLHMIDYECDEGMDIISSDAL